MCVIVCVCVSVYTVNDVHFSWLATGMAAMLKLVVASPHL